MQYEVYRKTGNQTELVGIVMRQSAAMRACSELSGPGIRVWATPVTPTRRDIRAVHVEPCGDSLSHRDFTRLSQLAP